MHRRKVNGISVEIGAKKNDTEMAGVVGFERTVHGIKTRGYCYQDSHNPLK